MKYRDNKKQIKYILQKIFIIDKEKDEAGARDGAKVGDPTCY